MADFSGVQGVLCNISGVLIKDCENGQDYAIKGSLEAFKRLQDSELPVLYCTNERCYSQKFVAEKLSDLGFHVAPEDVVSPISAILKLIREKNLRPHLLIHKRLAEEFADIDQTNPNAVVVGDAEDGFTFAAKNKAFQILKSSPDVELYALGMGKYLNQKETLQLDRPAIEVLYLEYYSRKKPIVIGKPSMDYYASAAKQLGVPIEKVIVIGDDFVSDVKGSQSAGMRGVLVKTGNYRSYDQKRKDVKPHAIADNLAQAVDWILA